MKIPPLFQMPRGSALVVFNSVALLGESEATKELEEMVGAEEPASAVPEEELDDVVPIKKLGGVAVLANDVCRGRPSNCCHSSRNSVFVSLSLLLSN